MEGNVNSELGKKIAILRALLLKTKIIVIKDTPSFLGERSIVSILLAHLPQRTIIKLTDSVEAAFDMQRIVHTRSLRILESGRINELRSNRKSSIGRILRSRNL